MRAFESIDAKSVIIGMLIAVVAAFTMGATGVDDQGKWDKNQKWLVLKVKMHGTAGGLSRFGEQSGDTPGFEPFAVEDGAVFIRQRLQ